MILIAKESILYSYRSPVPHLVLFPASVLPVARVDPLDNLIKETPAGPGTWQTELLLLDLLLLLLSLQRSSGPELRR